LAITVLLGGISFAVEAFDIDMGLTADLYLSQLEADTLTMKDNSASVSHISPDVLAEYKEFCLSNIYLDEPASRQAAKIIKYLKSTPKEKGDYANNADYASTKIKQVTTDRYRAMACMICFASAVNEETGEGKKFRDRINIAGEKNDYAAIKSIYQEWLAYMSRYQQVPLSGNSDIVEMTRKVMPATISAMKRDIAQVNQIISQHQVAVSRQGNNGGEAQEAAAKSCKSEGNCFRVTGTDSYFTGGKYTKIVCLAGNRKNVEEIVHYDDKGYYTAEIGSITRHDSLERAALEKCNLNYY
jgi:hypothetical protein